METSKPKDLIKLLKEAGKSDEYVIDILCSIIQSQIQYGGSLSDKLEYEIHNANKLLHKI